MKWYALILSLLMTGTLAAQPSRPNIVLILADDLGAWDLGVQGAMDLRTPHIDAIAGAGLRFDRFYANSPVCSPTRAALLTGRYPDLVGVPGVIRTHAENSWGYLSPDSKLLPAYLEEAGYRTAMVGKWHLGLTSPNLPNEHGFEFFRGFLGDMMDDYFTHRRHGINYMRENGREIDPKGHATDLFTDWAVEYVRDQQNQRGPFFLYVAYNAPHDPLQPRPDWLERVRAREPDMPEKRQRLAALIEHMDEGVGKIMATLRETGLDRNTLVVFTSDNGGVLAYRGNNARLRAGKGNVYEGGISVPAYITWPGHVRPGSRTGQVALTMDLMPTLLEVAGVKTPEGLDGVSLAALMDNPSGILPQRDVFFVRREGGAPYWGKSIDAIRRGNWKLVQNSPFGPLQLFNLAEDPFEERDELKAQPEIARELSRALQQHVQRGGAVPWQNQENRARVE